MPKIKIGQIGTGHGHASGKMEVLRKSSDFEVVGIVEPNAQLKTLAQQQPVFRDLPWMTVEELLGVSGLEVVAIETEPRHLLSHAETCVDAGKHIHLDKPAGESLAQFRRVLDSAASRHLCVQMGYMYRYNPAIVLLKDLIRKGFLGELFEVHCVMSKVVDDQSRIKHGEYVGGMMFELGCHVIDIVVDLLGQPAKISPFHQHSGRQSDTLQDNMLAVFEYAKAIATVKSTALEVDGGARRHVVVCGTGGTMHIEPLDAVKTARLTLSKDRGKYLRGVQEVAIAPYQRYVGDIADLAKVIRREKILDWSYMHDLAVQETVLRASGCLVDG